MQEGSIEHKVISMLWNCEKDMMKFSFRDVSKKAGKMRATKRNILSLLAGIFDPLGLINPMVTEFKVLFQQLCVGKINWDEKITGRFKKW